MRSQTNGLRDYCDREAVPVVALVGLHDHLLVIRDCQDVVRPGHRAGRDDGLSRPRPRPEPGPSGAREVRGRVGNRDRPPAAAYVGAVSDETRRSGPMRIARARVLLPSLLSKAWLRSSAPGDDEIAAVGWSTPVDTRMEAIGGTVFRRALSDVQHTIHDENVAAMKSDWRR